MGTLKKRDLEVLFMCDAIDEHAIQQLKEYEGKKMMDVSKEGLDLSLNEDEKKRMEEEKKTFEALCKKMKEILGESVEEVMVGERMVNSPASLVTTEYGWSANMQRIMKAQVLRDSQMSSFMMGKKKMEVNAGHPIMIELKKKFLENKTTLQNSPFLETLKKRDLEVLFMCDAIDEHAIQQLKEYEGKKMMDVSKEGLDLSLNED